MLSRREEGGDVRCNHRSDVRNLLDGELVGAHQPLERAEMPRESERGGLADLADAESVEQPRQRGALALLDGRQEIGGGLLAHALELQPAAAG